ncbi:MAG: hypothetical protein SH850_20125 [Planctomycetaceae bacterium]|nr:hypothetical protein [Planctomycetaceae bacterium]
MPIDDWPPLQPDPVIEAYKKEVDVTLLLENLKLTPTQRMDKLQAALRCVEEIQEARRKMQRKS